jgi:hypothetical protein
MENSNGGYDRPANLVFFFEFLNTLWLLVTLIHTANATSALGDRREESSVRRENTPNLSEVQTQ